MLCLLPSSQKTIWHVQGVEHSAVASVLVTVMESDERVFDEDNELSQS